MTPDNGWRPISEAPRDEWVLVVDSHGNVFAAHQQFGYWHAWFDYVSDDLTINDVVGWQPMPPPPGATK